MTVSNEAFQAARILIVDDNPVNVELLEALLEEEGFDNVTGITDPRKVVPLHTAEPFDLILLDIRMPGMDGHEVLAKLHEACGEGDYVPVLVLTAQTDLETRHRALEQGARDFVTKPFDRDEVLSRIRNLLEVRTLYTRQAHQKEQLEELVIERSGRLKAIMDNAPDVILATDAQGVVVECNDAAVATFGRDVTGVALSTLFTKSTPLPDTGSAETTALRQGERAFPMELSLAPLRRSGGGAERVLIGRDISQRKAMEAELEWLAHHDQVTRLPNRVALRQATREGLARHGCGVMVVAFLHGHRRLADLFGASAAERLFHMVGESLTTLLAAENGFLASWGDSMLVAFLPGVDNPTIAELIGREVSSALERIWVVEGFEVALGCRVGASLAPDHGDDPDTLVRRAALAASAGEAVWLYSETLETEVSRWHAMEAALRGALDRNELFLLYQPKICLDSGRTCGAEALMRWQSPDFGLVSPVSFIPIAEQTGLIDSFGAWAIEQAVRDTAEWDDLKLAVNVSIRQLGKPRLMETVQSVITGGLDPARLELEVTESAVMGDVEETLGALRRLRSLGVGLAIDDFGTGYSSLSYLSRMPLTTLKVDQSFVRGLGQNPESAAIVNMVLGLAKALNLLTVAEGIETAHHADLLTQAGCNLGQGWLYDKPLPREALAARLAAETERR